MKKEHLIAFFRSKIFKKITFVLGILFLIFSGFISLRPDIFLRFGILGIFIFNLFGPGILLIPSLARHMNILLLAIVSAGGTSLNDSVAWVIGVSGASIIPKSNNTKNIENTVKKYGVFALFFWSLIPFPYDLVGFVAGYLGLSYPRYIIPTFLGKLLRFLLIGAGVIQIFGKIPI